MNWGGLACRLGEELAVSAVGHHEGFGEREHLYHTQYLGLSRVLSFIFPSLSLSLKTQGKHGARADPSLRRREREEDSELLFSCC